ncbi:MAG: PQQ-like beta-propeller repeat protein [Fuerstiella sp.]|nr:PQQ-like beta-propeller repeat protein [Fuerstiella sp.]
MVKRLVVFVGAIFFVGSIVACLAAGAGGADFEHLKSVNWHQWRGPDASGVSTDADPPVTWSEDRNIQWRVQVDGLGNSTPIIWQDKVFLTTAIDTGRVDPSLTPPDEQPERPFGIRYPNTFHQYVVVCLDRKSGDEIWRRVAAETVPQEGHHSDNSFSTASPTTDGERLYAWFGMAGLYCYDLNGTHLWDRDLGPVKTRLSFGEGASPVVYGDRLVVVRDNDGQSSITVLDCLSGRTVWQKDRDEPSCWATPLIVQHNGTIQVVTNAHNRVRSYDLASGDLIWECGGQVSNVTPSPVAANNTVFCMSGYRGSALFALPLDVLGDITDGERIVWSQLQGTPYIPSPLLYDGRLYFNQSNKAILTCLDAETGRVVIERTRMPQVRGIYASPVAAAGRIYFVGRRGTTLVLEKTDRLKVLATNRLAEQFDASPAIAGDQLFLRGKQRLYCVANHGL